MRILSILFFFSFISTLNGQHQFGAVTDNYSPTQSVFLNPASVVGSKAKWDLHIAGIGVFADNNMLFLPKDQFRLIRGAEQFSSLSGPVMQMGNHSRSGRVESFVQGPSISAVFGRFAFGLHTAVRLNAGFSGVSEELSNFIFNGFGYSPQQDVLYTESGLKVGASAYAEAGLTLGYSVLQKGKHMLHVAATPRRLIGIGSVSAEVDEFAFMVGDSSQLDVAALTGRAGIAMPGWNHGRGWGLNAGVMYYRMKDDVSDYRAFSRKSNCATADYRYKIGFSVMDIGSINFDRNASFTDINGFTLQVGNYNSDLPESQEELDSLWNSTTSGSIESTDAFRQNLPTTLSLQFDYNVGKGFYASMNWVQGISGTPARAGVVNLTPRFETKRFAVALPVTLHQYRYPRVGLSFRFNSLIIGTDRLGPLLFNPDVYGMDIYLAVKYTIFRGSSCKQRKKPVAKMSGETALPCPTWD